jgi:hypothetical protein
MVLAVSGPQDHPGARLDRSPESLPRCSSFAISVFSVPVGPSPNGHRDFAKERRGRKDAALLISCLGLLDFTLRSRVELNVH